MQRNRRVFSSAPQNPDPLGQEDAASGRLVLVDVQKVLDGGLVDLVIRRRQLGRQCSDDVKESVASGAGCNVERAASCRTYYFGRFPRRVLFAPALRTDLR